MNQNDYGDFVDKQAPTNDAFGPLHEAVALARQKQKEIAELSDKLNSAQAVLNGIIYGSMPTMMAAMNLKEFKTIDDLKIELKDETSASITKDNEAEALRWLDENGHGAIIKRELSIAFSKGQNDQAKALRDLLAKDYPNLADCQTVHHSTLKSWATDMLKTGKPISDKISVRQVKVAKFPKAKGT